MASSPRHIGRLAGVARRLALVALVIVFATTGAVSQTPTDIAVVVNPSVAVDNLSVAELRRILLGDREFWSAGTRVTLLIRAPIARERDAVVRDVCQMTEAQFRQHWIGKVFRADTPSGPKIVYSQRNGDRSGQPYPGRDHLRSGASDE